MPRNSTNISTIIAVFILGIVLATFLPYVQNQFKSPNIIFVSQDRYVCPDSFYGTFDITLKNIGATGRVTSLISSEQVYFENKDKEIQHNDSLSYIILEGQDLRLRFIPPSDYKYRQEYEKLKNVTIALIVHCEHDSFGSPKSCGARELTCIYENNNYPYGADFRLLKEK